MNLIKPPDTFLRGSNEKIEFPLSEENKIIKWGRKKHGDTTED